MNQAHIQQNIQNLINNFNRDSFIFDLLLAYGLPKASITRLRKGNLNLSSAPGEISWKRKLFFKEADGNDLHLTISQLPDRIKHDQRFIIVTDYETFLAIDTKTNDNLDIPFKELPARFDFFLPWAGMEKATHKNENPADVKAAEKMARLFDTIKKDNSDDSPEFIHGLNVFLSRLLFCFFAEDTNIFRENQFINALDTHTNTDGSDLSLWFETFFIVLDTPKNQRKNIPDYLNSFPYVNGSLFNKRFPIPSFTRRSRQAIIDGGQLQWKDINPDIFGSMFQAVIGNDQRGSLGQHYTSVPNIMKVIEPLFLNELYEDFEKAKGNPQKLRNLLHRLGTIKIFDPACGSGNFLIIAYKELRNLENKIIHHLQELQKIASGFKAKNEQLSLIPKSQLNLAASFQVELFSHINLNQFYGIEIDDFAHEVAMLALWLAEHQMNVEFKKQFGQTSPTLPLKDAGNILQGNATRLNWEEVCPKSKDDEVFVLGNPPYLGARMQSEKQKSDMAVVFEGFKWFNNLDYIACWFKKGADYIHNSHSNFAFVTTNSISQGNQVEILWPYILKKGASISFVHPSFKWTNNAKKNAGVIVAIIGLTNNPDKQKTIFSEGVKKNTKNINPYLVEGNNVFIQKRYKPLSNLPEMTFGSMPNDSGALILNQNEKKELLNSSNKSSLFIKRFIGSNEFIRGNERWCIWLNDEVLSEALEIPEIKKRLELVKIARNKSKRLATKKLASTPHKFGEIRHKNTASIIIPSVSSERRHYIPIGFLNKETVISNLALAIYDAEPWMFGILTSNLHMLWVKTIGGYLGTSIRYSISICYNTFPFPPISDKRKQEITQGVFRILEEREKHSEKTMAQLYDPDKMPEGLREAHRLNDLAVERCYRSRPFESDEERLEHLFKLYERMIEEEKNQNTLFQKQKKSRKK